MHRAIRTALIVLLVLVVPMVSLACLGNEVSVRTGYILECKYDHVIKDTTRYVKVPAEKAKDYKVSGEVTVCAAHARAQQLYAQAQKALAAGNKSKARALFGTVADLDPGFKDVASKYKALGGKPPASGTIAKKSPTSDGGSGNGGSGNGGSGNGGSGDKTDGGKQQGSGYLDRIPASLSPLPYKQVRKSEDLLSGTRLFAARQSSYKVRLLTVNVTWIGKKTKFADWYARMLGAKFSMDKDRRVSVPGTTGRFGTDGGKLGNLCWARGGLVYQVELEAKSGSPGSLKPEAKTVAQKL